MTLERKDFVYFLEIPTRWLDVDVYGHVNNVVYYSYFDTVVNTHLIEEAGLDVHKAPQIGVVVETQCVYFKELHFPGTVDAGIRVVHLGNRSVQYSIGLFRQGDESPAATGRFVHVYIDRKTRKSVSIPPTIRSALTSLIPPELGIESHTKFGATEPNKSGKVSKAPKTPTQGE